MAAPAVTHDAPRLTPGCTRCDIFTLGIDPPRRERQDGAAPDGTLVVGDHIGHLYPPVAGLRRSKHGKLSSARCQLLRALCGQQRDHPDVFAGQISEDGSTCGSSTTASSSRTASPSS